jgi:hypothetical protein
MFIVLTYRLIDIAFSLWSYIDASGQTFALLSTPFRTRKHRLLNLTGRTVTRMLVPWFNSPYCLVPGL